MKAYIKYELFNSLGNFFTILFGIIFPILVSLLFYSIFGKQVPESEMALFTTQLFVTNLLVSPLAVVFIGFAALFSQEIEKEVTLRMSLFGYTEAKQMQAKFCAQAIMSTLLIIVYIAVVAPIIKVPMPTAFGLLVFVIGLCLLSFSLFLAAYGISLLLKKFSTTFGTVMSVYFLIMILSGMMGIQTHQLPKPIQSIAKLLPTTHMIEDIPKLWQQSQYNLMPMIQSMIFLLAVSIILYLLGIGSKKRKH
ncbi:ABC transporter permease [Irregularibacter muris]|uniref:ABC transporter permease n=1 Tax=Irregularibacter muris TaxID=1796619 RepID=A0AAE3KYH4_9FIRM|nr:ABC transporter permease [Irregularibacter muris]MCR1897480.1 ABC transporter permease [Irregularibacter muris]